MLPHALAASQVTLQVKPLGQVKLFWFVPVAVHVAGWVVVVHTAQPAGQLVSTTQ
jgi:hypothetical protein